MDKIFQSFSSQCYDGSSDPKEFFKSFYLQASMFNLDDAKQAKVVPFFLKGKAERLYNAMAVDKDKIDAVAKAIIDGCTQSQEVLLHSFYNRRPREDETLSQFALALQDLLSKAVPTMGNTEKTIFLRQQLNAHLPDHMRALIQFNSNKSWDDLLVALDQASPHIDVNFYASNCQPSLVSVKQEPLELNATSTIRRKQSFTGVCHYCKKTGHKIANCFKREQANNRQSNQAPRSNRSFSSSNSRPSLENSSGNRTTTRTNNNRSTNTNTVQLFNNDSDTAESNTLELKTSRQIDLTSVSTSVPLMRKSALVSLRGYSEQFNSINFFTNIKFCF